jgi:hypothetical protein
LGVPGFDCSSADQLTAMLLFAATTHLCDSVGGGWGGKDKGRGGRRGGRERGGGGKGERVRFERERER